MNTSTYFALIMRALDRLEHNGTAPSIQDKSNSGTLMARAFLWQTIASEAKKREDQAYRELESATETEEETRSRNAGEHVIAQSPKFAYIAKLSKPSMLFSQDELVTALNKSKYKIPAPIAREFIEKAKKEGKRKLSLSVAEKSDS